MFASILGHIGDGNFHESIMYDRNDPEELARIETSVHAMVDRALEMEGTCTGEHGVGLGKKVRTTLDGNTAFGTKAACRSIFLRSLV